MQISSWGTNESKKFESLPIKHVLTSKNYYLTRPPPSVAHRILHVASAASKRDARTVPSGNALRVLVLLLTNLGDVVLHLSFLRSLASAVGNGYVDVIVKPTMEQLLFQGLGLRRVIVMHCPWVGSIAWVNGVLPWLKTLSMLKEEQYDLVFVTHPHEMSSLTARLIDPKCAIGWVKKGDRFLDVALPEESRSGHASEWPMQLLRAANVPLVRYPPLTLPLDGSRFQDGRKSMSSAIIDSGNAGRTILAVHPGAGGKAKWFPWQQYSKVIREMVSNPSWSVVLFGGANELSICHQIQSAVASEAVINLAGRFEIPELAGALSLAIVYLGNDSGPSHMAAALGVPTVAVFGPYSDASKWSPVGPRVAVITLTDAEFTDPDTPAARSMITDQIQRLADTRLEA